MMEQRCCSRCHGREFKVVTPVDSHGHWSTGTSTEEQWFCPRCDWGRAPHHEPRSQKA